jgi:hypothetical protein
MGKFSKYLKKTLNEEHKSGLHGWQKEMYDILSDLKYVKLYEDDENKIKGEANDKINYYLNNIKINTKKLTEFVDKIKEKQGINEELTIDNRWTILYKYIDDADTWGDENDVNMMIKFIEETKNLFNEKDKQELINLTKNEKYEKAVDLIFKLVDKLPDDEHKKEFNKYFND